MTSVVAEEVRPARVAVARAAVARRRVRRDAQPVRVRRVERPGRHHPDVVVEVPVAARPVRHLVRAVAHRGELLRRRAASTSEPASGSPAGSMPRTALSSTTTAMSCGSLFDCPVQRSASNVPAVDLVARLVGGVERHPRPRSPSSPQCAAVRNTVGRDQRAGAVQPGAVRVLRRRHEPADVRMAVPVRRRRP